MSIEQNRVPTLGRLRSVDLREVWPSEPYSFTPWLAQPENLQLLAEALDLPGLELVSTEREVDIFSADIVAKAPDTGETVLIENQIERSDHTHLGQVLTYAAGLEAAIIVWIAKRFSDGHRAACDWLNRITTQEFAFFAVEVEAFRIGDSVPAPRFNVVSRPNEWARTLRAVSHRAESTADHLAFQRYWDGYDDSAKAIGAPTRVASEQVRSTNYYIKTEMSDVYYAAWRAPGKGRIGIYLAIYGNDAEKIFNDFVARRSEIEQRFGGALDWSVRKPGSIFWIIAGRLDANPDDSDWARQHGWLAETMKRLVDAVGPVLAGLPPEERT